MCGKYIYKQYLSYNTYMYNIHTQLEINRNKYTTDIIIDDKYIYIHYIYILKIK